MLNRITAALAICLAALTCMVSAEEARTVESMDELNAVLQEAADAMQKKISLRLSGPLSKKKLNALLSRSLLFNHSRSYRFVSDSETRYTLYMNQMDCSRMLAAYRNPTLESKLSDQERESLKLAKRCIKKYTRKSKSRMENLKALHDALVTRVMYDKPSGPECTTMMLRDKGVCDAYSRCMYLMLNMMDIPCHIVVGKAGGVAHAWNLVELEDGEWLHVDATWDDPIMPGRKQILRHDYFCLTDDEIKKDHRWIRGQYPVSAKEKGYYFRKSDLYFDNYEDFWVAAQRAYDKKAKGFSAYLECFGNARKFHENYQKHCDKGGHMELAYWHPPVGRRKGVVSLAFNNKGAPEPDFPEPVAEEEVILPLEDEEKPSWLEPEIWKDFTESFDMDAVVKEGSKLLLKGINTAEGMAEDFQKTEGSLEKKSRAVLDGLLKKMGK